MLEILSRLPRPRHPGPRPRFYGRGRFYGGYYYPPEVQVIEVERSPALPWRVTTTSSWGGTVLMQTASMQDALRYYRNHKFPSPPPFNIEVALEHWTGSGWKKEAIKNSSDRR